MSYFANIRRGIKTTAKGMSLTLKHLWNARKTKGPINVQHPDYFAMADGHVTLQYPHQTLQVPEIGRYQLDCEIDDCIVCDKCAKICPVDCIEIEAIKSPELIRYASDGSPVRLHAAKFDIDMAKCCFCGLCTTVCPTECLVMNSEYDYSVIDITQLNFAFANLTEAEAQEKRELYDQFVAEKEAAKQNKAETQAPSAPAEQPKGFAPRFKPVMKPAEPKAEEPEAAESKPAFTPKFKPKAPAAEDTVTEEKTEAPKFVPKFQPKIKPAASEEVINKDKAEVPADAAPKFVPKFQPKLKPVGTETKAEDIPEAESKSEAAPKFVPKFQPKLKPVRIDTKTEAQPESEPKAEETVTPKFVPKFQPKLKPVYKPENTEDNVDTPEIKAEAASAESITEPVPAKVEETKVSEETEKPKVVFRPTLKPKK